VSEVFWGRCFVFLSFEFVDVCVFFGGGGAGGLET